MKEAGRDRVDADAAAPPRDGQLARQPHQACLARGVRGVLRSVHGGLDAGDRRHVDDAPVLALQHVAAGRLRTEKRAGEVDVDHLLPLVERHLLGGRAPGHARVVDEDVDVAVGRDRLVDHRLHLVGLGDVADRPFDRKPRRASRDGRRQPFVAAGAQHERGAGFGEPFRHFEPEATRSAGDDGHAAGQIEQFGESRHVEAYTDRLVDLSTGASHDLVRPGHGRGRAIPDPDARADDVFIREDLSDEQRLFGQTAAEFMRNEVLPREQPLYAHDWTLTRELLRKAAALDLTRLEIPAAYGGLGLDKISAAYVGEQIAVNPSFAGSLGAHTSIGTLPLVYFGTDEQKARYLPRLASAELIGAYALTEPEPAPTRWPRARRRG